MQQKESVVVITSGGTLIGHAGLRKEKSFPRSTGFVLTVAPGVDYAMVLTAFLCRMQYLTRSNSHHGSHAHSAASAGANAGGISGGVAGAGSAGGGF